jgi:hypothetical protein
MATSIAGWLGMGLGSMLLGTGLSLWMKYQRTAPNFRISDVLEFPATDDELPINLLVVGDTGTGNEHQKKVAELLEKLCQRNHPAAMVLLGDNFYQHGVESTQDSLWNSRFNDIYQGECLKELPTLAILGNHDVRTNPRAQIEYTLSSSRWKMPGRTYLARFGKLLDIYAMDTNLADRCLGGCSIDQLEKQASESQARWKVLIGHHPLMTYGKYHQASWMVRWFAPDLYCRGKMSQYWAGHDHNFQHILLPGEQTAFNFRAPCTMEQYVIGTGGANLAEVRFGEYSRFAKSAHGAMLVKVAMGAIENYFFEIPADGVDPAQVLVPAYYSITSVLAAAKTNDDLP